MTSPRNNQRTARQKGPGFKASLLVLLLVVAFVLVPFLFWRNTWFGRPLSREDTAKYLYDDEHPRKTQHALSQIADRIIAGDSKVRRWYPRVVELRDHEKTEIRATVAWVMGQDNQSEEFHGALLAMLNDPEPVVRRNAALSLIRFGDTNGKEELRQILQSHQVRAPAEGTLASRLKTGDTVNPGTLLGRVQARKKEIEIRSPLPGRVERWLARDGARVAAGEPVVSLAPSPEQVWEALRALYLVGQMEDLPAVERYAQGAANMPARIQQQARLTARAIRHRAAREAGVETAEDPD